MDREWTVAEVPVSLLSCVCGRGCDTKAGSDGVVLVLSTLPPAHGTSRKARHLPLASGTRRPRLGLWALDAAVDTCACLGIAIPRGCAAERWAAGHGASLTTSARHLPVEGCTGVSCRTERGPWHSGGPGSELLLRDAWRQDRPPLQCPWGVFL